VKEIGQKDSRGPVRAKVHLSRTKKWNLVFFNSQGATYLNHASKGAMLNSSYNQNSAAQIHEGAEEEETVCGRRRLVIDWDNASVLTPPLCMTV
jgi:hypothetical protein